MNMTHFFLLFLAFALINARPCKHPSKDKILLIQQDQTSMQGLGQIFSTCGDLSGLVNWTIAFPWPLIQLTYNPNEQNFIVITYPIGQDNAVIYTMNVLGQIVGTLPVSNLALFDLQYSPQQRTIYGIAVSSRYGRDLSSFAFSRDGILHKPLFTLPYMWYINASSFDYATNRYFGLLNNFPGQPDSNENQKFLIGSMTPNSADVKVFDYDATQTQLKYQYIAYSQRDEKLYGLLYSLSSQNSSLFAAITEIDPITGVPGPLLVTTPITSLVDVGPLVINSDGILVWYVRSNWVPSCWILHNYVPHTQTDYVVDAKCGTNLANRYVAAAIAPKH